MRGVLVVSLALNLAVVAALAGAAWRHAGKGGGDRGGSHASSRGGPAYLQALAPETRRALRENLRGMGRGTARSGEMVRVLRAVPFDPSAAAAVLMQERTLGQIRMQAASDAWLDEVSAMSVQERAAYADRLEQIEARRKERREKRRQNRD